MDTEIKECVILNKFLLTDDECDMFLHLYKNNVKHTTGSLGGHREFITVDIPINIKNKLITLLSNYIIVKDISTGNIHHTISGAINEHQDASFYSEKIKEYSKYTLIIYLSETEENTGFTRIKREKINKFENDDTNKKHERISIKPVKGYSVLFNHHLYHHSTESYGDKYILLLKIW